MSIFETHEEATKNKDIDAYAETLHDDYQFISHMDGMTMDKEKSMEMFSFLMTSDDFVTHESRCLYENDEVMVTHAIMGFPDGTREAVLAFHRLKDGKIIRMETGATLLK
ncbi:nuclear transport factor 2 family protein [Candidatus Thioglobus sp.]|nr:nuclear transport factor 2 family protein [Candidatus Thioglobus sp.]